MTTVVDQIRAIKVVRKLLDENGKHHHTLAELDSLHRRIQQRANHNRDMGIVFRRQYGERLDVQLASASADDLGELIRAAVEATGSTITDPPQPATEEDTANV